ncbi:hypothetical protein H4R27_000681 [Coemansia aciculifera]|nr:hypothetical protein H4R27_000681 [Coemansia aciculifera]
MESVTVVLEKSKRSINIECPTTISSEHSLSQIQQFPPLKTWLQSLDQQSSISVSKLCIQSVDAFKSGNIGFIKFITDAHIGDKNIPGIVFLRGGSIAVLLILRTQVKPRVASHLDSDYCVMVEQPRVAVPDFALQELPAGMLDNGVGVTTAVREILEETGIRIEAGDLVDLGAAYPSPGACDESVGLYACEKQVTGEELGRVKDRLGGLSDELITVRLVRVCDLWRQTSDMKALTALYLWDRQMG